MKILNDLKEKEKKIYIVAAIVLAVILVTGFLLWRINQKAKLSSDESEAAGTMACGTYGCVQDSDCQGWTGVGGDYECDEVMSHIPSQQRCVRLRCPTGYTLESDRCTCTAIVVNTCEGGGRVRRPSTFAEDESFTISGYGEDADGISANSIDVKIDGSSISGHKISKQVDGNRTNWSTTLSDLSVGSHTVVVSWEDSKGKGGGNCTLTSTFTVTAVVVVEEEEEEKEEEEETVVVTTTETTVPQTGLLDEAWGKVVLGFGILGMGMILMKYNIFEFNWSGVEIRREVVKKKHGGRLKNKFERQVVKDN